MVIRISSMKNRFPKASWTGGQVLYLGSTYYDRIGRNTAFSARGFRGDASWNVIIIIVRFAF